MTASVDTITSAQALTVANGSTDYTESWIPFAWTDTTVATLLLQGDD